MYHAHSTIEVLPSESRQCYLVDFVHTVDLAGSGMRPFLGFVADVCL